MSNENVGLPEVCESIGKVMRICQERGYTVVGKQLAAALRSARAAEKHENVAARKAAKSAKSDAYQNGRKAKLAAKLSKLQEQIAKFTAEVAK